MSSTPLCPTRNQLGRASPFHHQPDKEAVSLWVYYTNCDIEGRDYLLLELLVDSFQRVLDGYTFEIAGGDLQTQRKMQVNFLDRRLNKEQLQVVFVFYTRWRSVEFPGNRVNLRRDFY